jgi:hypothetical protein
MRRVGLVLLITCACAAAACGSGGDADDTPGDDGGDGAPAAGFVQIEESELDTIGAVASIYAGFEDPPAPDLVNDGTCRIYEYPCLGQVGACASPPQHSAGTLAITGLALPVSMTPDAETHSYAAPSGLPDELFTDTAAIRATATGDTVPAFDLQTTGVVPMSSAYVGAELGLTPGQPLALAWDTAADDATIQLRVNWADVCHAGAEWYVLVCEVADAGSFIVPSTITSMLPTGFSHCGARLARMRRATTADGSVELTVASADYFGFL